MKYYSTRDKAHARPCSLREAVEAGLIAQQPRLQAYLDRCLARPAFQRALAAQLEAFSEEAGPPAG